MGDIINNQVLFYSILAIFCVGAIILFTLIYMDRKNLKLFQAEEKDLLEDLEEKEEVKITKVTPDLEKPKANLEEVLEKMQADLDKKEDVVAIFEQEQEEKAIISYQELLQSKNKNATASNKELLSVIEQIERPKEEFVYEEPIEALPKMEEISSFEEPLAALPDLEESLFPKVSTVKEEPKKFKTTDFISPVYGKQESNIEYPKIPNFSEGRNSIELEKKVDTFEDLDSNHNDAFLNALKEFRSHLE